MHHRTSRRKFVGNLAWAGVGAGAGIVGLPRLASAAPDKAARVAVVGAGLAGLTCAYRLAQAGVRATVYEANTRLGGRCWTRRSDFAEGQIAEHGGELIDQSHTSIRQLAQELGLPLDNLVRAERNGTEPLYYFDGSPYSYAAAVEDLKTIWKPMHRDLSETGFPTLYNQYTQRGWELDHMSIIDWITQTVPGGMDSPLGQLLDTAYNIEYGGECAEQSALNLIYLLAYAGPGQLRVFGHSDEKYHVRGGNDLLAARMAALLQNQIVTGTALVSLRRTARGEFRLAFDSGAGRKEATFEHVVLALPLSMLRRVDLSDSGFSALKQTSIQETPMGTSAKLHLQFQRRHWESLGLTGETFSDRGYQNTWEVTRGQPGASGILVDYTGGNIGNSFGQGTPAELAAQFLTQIEPVLPGLSATWNGRSTIDYWAGNPFSHGSYPFWKVGQYTRFGGIEGEREGNCHFCGDHTSIESQGYLNGAVETGERAAGEVLGR